MKKILTRPETVVQEMCNGIVLAHPELELVPKYKVIRKKQLEPGHVRLISGGGSGHEPAHAGFVGRGMLDAAVCGDVFASPSQIQVYQGIKAVAGDAGVLLIVKNYSGDIMNFKNGAHLAKEDGIQVEYVKVDDDIAVEDSLYTVGRRGVAGTVFVHKVAGAAAAQGKPLAEVKAAAQLAAENVRSIGFALTSCTVPAKGSPTFALAEEEMEYGVGIHGEPGIRREAVMDAHELAGRMVGSLCGELGIKTGDGGRVALLVNGFGATPLMELYLFSNELRAELAKRSVQVARNLVGNFMTSIDMAGASVSLLRLNGRVGLEEYLNHPCATPALHIDGPVPTLEYFDPFAAAARPAEDADAQPAAGSAELSEEFTLDNMLYVLQVMTDSILKNEQYFCELDSHAGDGDFGMSVAKGFRQLRREWPEIIGQNGLTIGRLLEDSSLVIMEYCGGASGPIWGSAFRAAGRSAGDKAALSVPEFAEMLQAAVKGIQDTGERSFGRGAVLGDKTLLDALIPCADAWSARKDGDFVAAFRAGARAAVDGAKSTEAIVARMGRAGAVGERSIGYPDAGAHALGVIFTGIANALSGG